MTLAHLLELVNIIDFEAWLIKDINTNSPFNGQTRILDFLLAIIRPSLQLQLHYDTLSTPLLFALSVDCKLPLIATAFSETRCGFA